MVKRFWNTSGMRFVREMVSIYFGKNISRASAELAYFMVLSLFPVLLCVSAFIGSLHVDVNNILSVLEPILPPTLLNVVAEYLGYVTTNETPGLFAAGLVMVLFSASAAMRGIMNIMDDIYEQRRFKGGWKILASVIFSLLLLVTIYLSMVVVLTGNWFFHLLQRYLPFQLDLGDGGDWQWVRFLLLFGLVFVLILLVYFMSAPRGKPRPPVVGGALGASVALVVASAIFSWFIGVSSRYSLVYGSLTSLVILLLWLYICGNIIILGNVFNCVRYRRKKAKAQRLAEGRSGQKKG